MKEAKTFEGDFFKILNLLKEGEKFSFSKYCDGEYAILRDVQITNCDGWKYRPEEDAIYGKALLDSFKYNDDGYYVGIMAPCCISMSKVQWMRDNVSVPEERLTWANLFVNSNYKLFKEHFIPEFNNHDIILVSSNRTKLENLPFKVEEHYGIGKTAWRDDYGLIDVLSKKDYKDKLFLFCAGPLGNMLAARLWEINKNNTYIDIGSTLNPWIVGNNRGYLKGKSTLSQTCKWYDNRH